MAGDNTLGTLLAGAALVGTAGSAALGAGIATGAQGAVGAVGPTLVPTLFGATASTLSAIGTVGAVGSVALAGFEGQRAAQFEQAQIATQRRSVEVEEARRRAQRERELSDILSSQQAIFGARGVALGSGVPETAARESISAATREQSISALNTAGQLSALTRSSQQLALEGRAAVTGGLTQAGTLLSDATRRGI